MSSFSRMRLSSNMRNRKKRTRSRESAPLMLRNWFGSLLSSLRLREHGIGKSLACWDYWDCLEMLLVSGWCGLVCYLRYPKCHFLPCKLELLALLLSWLYLWSCLSSWLIPMLKVLDQVKSHEELANSCRNLQPKMRIDGIHEGRHDISFVQSSRDVSNEKIGTWALRAKNKKYMMWWCHHLLAPSTQQPFKLNLKPNHLYLNAQDTITVGLTQRPRA